MWQLRRTTGTTQREIAGLKLDAEWVILSACNTAASGAEAAEAMSGLARVLLCRGASVACLPLVSLFGRDCEADNGCSGADGPRQKRGACRGHASVDARDDRQRQILRGASGLLGRSWSWARGQQGEGPLLPANRE